MSDTNSHSLQGLKVCQGEVEVSDAKGKVEYDCVSM